MNRLSNEDFIKKADKKHNRLYDYSLTEYINSKTKIKILCSEHEIFEQIPNNHLNGKGCPKCKGGISSNKEEFIEYCNKKQPYKD